MSRIPYLLVAALSSTLLAAAYLCGRAEAHPHLGPTERAVIGLVNVERSRHGLPAVRPSFSLSRAADRHSGDMLARDFFAHTSPDGTSFDRRVRRFARGKVVGETLAALGVRRGGAPTIVRMWMDSPPHRAILLAGGFRRIGVARRWGTLNGAPMAVVTADFASAR